MKKSIILGTLFASVVALSSCDNFLDDNRYPLTSETNNTEYWNNEDNVKLQCDQMLQYFTGYATGSSYGEFYFNTLTDDQCGSSFVDWKTKSVPSSSTSYTSPYTNIRHATEIIDGLSTSTLDEDIKASEYNQSDCADIVARFGERRGELSIGGEQAGNDGLDAVAEGRQTSKNSFGLVHFGRRNHFHCTGNLLG